MQNKYTHVLPTEDAMNPLFIKLKALHFRDKYTRKENAEVMKICLVVTQNKKFKKQRKARQLHLYSTTTRSVLCIKHKATGKHIQIHIFKEFLKELHRKLKQH